MPCGSNLHGKNNNAMVKPKEKITLQIVDEQPSSSIGQNKTKSSSSTKLKSIKMIDPCFELVLEKEEKKEESGKAGKCRKLSSVDKVGQADALVSKTFE